MSVLSVSLNSSLSSVGISAANPSQLTAIRDTVGGTVKGGQRGDTASEASQAAKGEDKAARPADTELTPEEKKRIAELKRIDAEVRAHEQAHITVGRGLVTSGPNYQYTYGPDGKQYAVAGEVGIDTSPEQEPQENIDKGLHIQATALAPIDPSPQDYSVAASGKNLEQQGRTDLRAQRAEAEQQRDSRLQAYDSPGNTLGASSRVDVYA
jgi:hypothetical protein